MNRHDPNPAASDSQDSPEGNPLHAAWYADQAVWRREQIVEHVPLAQRTWRLRVSSDQLARRIRPGQFVMLRLAGCDDPLIGRPLALYDAAAPTESPAWIDVVYLVKGKLTTRLESLGVGREVEIWGPLGNGFSIRDDDHLILAAGGIGQTPFLALARQRLGRQAYGGLAGDAGGTARRITLCYGARTAGLLAGLDDFASAGMELRLATDDGTRGHHGRVTDVLDAALRERSGDAHVICCGPEVMMESAAEVARSHGVSCEVSLETPMACGIGVCFTCVARIRQPDGSWDYKRTCVDGPVFDARDVVWR